MARFVPFSVGALSESTDATTRGQPLPPQRATLVLGRAAPDPCPLVRLQSVFEAVVDYGATKADLESAVDRGGVSVPDGEEQRVAVAGTGGPLPPLGLELCCQLPWARAHTPSFALFHWFAKTTLDPVSRRLRLGALAGCS